MAKRLLSIFLCVLMLISVIPGAAIYAEQENDTAEQTDNSDQTDVPAKALTVTPALTAAYNPTAWVEGYGDGSRSGFRASQTLSVKTSGFASNSRLKYYYYSTSDSESFGVADGWWIDIPVRLNKAEIPSIPYKDRLPYKGNIFQKAAIAAQNLIIDIENAAIAVANVAIALANVIIAMDNACYVESYSCSSTTFRLHGNSRSNSRIRITVKDENPSSSTYNRSVEIYVGGFNSANLSADLNVPYAMEVGQSIYAYQLLEEYGVAHVYGCGGTSITNLKITDVSNNAVSQNDKTLTGVNAGISQMQITVKKSGSCTYHGGQTGSATTYIYVFKKPTITPVPGGFEITNTQSGVTYSAGNQSVKCNEDDETLQIKNLASNTKYDVVLSATLPNGKTAHKHYSSQTPSPYYGYLSYAILNGIQKIPDLEINNKNDKSAYPAGPYAPGYIITNWYDDATFTVLHDFEQSITQNFRIYGKWEALKSTLNLTINSEGSALTDKTVELYQNEVKIYTLTESETAGKYTIADAVVNGNYNVYVNGADTKAVITVNTVRTEKNLTKEQKANVLSGEAFNITVNLNKLSVITRLDGNVIQMENGEVVLFDGTSFYGSTYISNEYVTYFVSSDNTVYDVYYNGADTDLLGDTDETKNVSKTHKTVTIDFYTATVNLITDDSNWVPDTVILRSDSGAYITTLTASGEYANGQRAYTTVLQKDDRATPRDLYIYVEGVNTGASITATETGKETSVSFITTLVTVNQDGSGKTDAELNFASTSKSYTVTDNTSGVYKTHLLDEGKAYTVSVAGAVDTDKITVSKNDSVKTVNFYTVEFKTSNDEEKNTVNYRTYLVREGNIITPPVGAYYEGMTFKCWNTNAYAENEAKQTSYDFSTEINAKTTLYAHFAKPTVEVNGFVKADADGTVNTKGTSYIMPNLAVTGFDDGKVINSIKIEFTGISTVKIPSNANVTIAVENGTAPTAENGYYTFTEDANTVVTFTELLTYSEAQSYLRGIIVTPLANTDNTISFSVSDGIVSLYTEDDWDYTTSSPTVSYTKIKSTDTTLGATGTDTYYYLAESMTFNQSKTNNNGLVINGNVTIYIPSGVTLTAYGKDAAATIPKNGNIPEIPATPGRAAIKVDSGNTLTIIGNGTVVAVGGNASNGLNGGNGSYAYLCVNSTAVAHAAHAEGGAGGEGGSGAGAGIGTDGGLCGKGAGGTAGLDYQVIDWVNIRPYNPYIRGHHSGSNGKAGSPSGQCGTINISSTLDISNVKGGSAGTKSGTAGYSLDSTGNYGKIRSHYEDVYGWYSTATGGAGGGGGGAGYAAAAIGTGGAGGGGGGSGGGGTAVHSKSNYYYGRANGGTGGKGAINGANAGNNGCNDFTANGGYSIATSGGTGGAAGGGAGTSSYQTLNTMPSNTVTFDGTSFESTSNGYSYAMFDVAGTKKITVPDLTAPAGLAFDGWEITTPGCTVSSETDPFTVGDTKIYQATEQVTITDETVGDITLKPVFTAIKSKKAETTFTVTNSEFTPEPTYYTYEINTTVNGTAKSIGNITLSDGTNEIVVGEKSEGVYELILTTNKTYDIYINGVDSNVNVTSESAANVNLKTMTLSLTLNGETDTEARDVKFVGSSSQVVGTAQYNAGVLTGDYRYMAMADTMEDSYRVYVDNENIGISIAPGENKTISYYKVTVTLAGNVTPTLATLRSSENGEVRLKAGANNTYTAIAMESSVTYDVCFNGLASGESVKFNSTANEATVTMNKLTVNVNKNGQPNESQLYTPVYDGDPLEKISAGEYTVTVFGEIGKVKINGREFTLTNNAVTVNLYTVSYSVGDATGNTPTDNTVYYEGDTVTLSQDRAFTKTGGEFQGWTMSETLYPAGAEIEIDKELNLTISFKDASEFDALITIGAETHYINANEIPIYLSNRKAGEGAEITILRNCTLVDTTLGEDDVLTVKSPANATIPTDVSFANNGNITIEEGGTITASGTLENSADIKVNGTLKVTDGVLTNNKNATIENNGTLWFIGSQFDNAGKLDNKNDFVIDADKMTNNGTIYNTAQIITNTDPDYGIWNNGNIFNVDGVIKVVIHNKGKVSGGEVESPAYIDGGTVERVNGNPSVYYLHADGGTNGGNPVSEQANNYTVGTAVILPTLTKSGYTFKGWYKNSDFTGNAVNGISEDDDGVLQFYAKWEDESENGKQADYYLFGNGGMITGNPAVEIHTTTPYQYTQGTVTTLPTLVKEGFIFDGWYTNSELTGDEISEIGTDEKGTLFFFAKWSNDPNVTGPATVVSFGSGKDKIEATSEVSSETNCTASGLDKVTEDIFYDEVINNGLEKSINMVLEANLVDDKKTEGQLAIKEAASGTNVSYIDASLTKVIGENESSENVTEIDTAIEIIIPYDITGKLNIGVSRYHNGEVENFTQSNDHRDGTFYIEGEGENAKLHLFSSKFSAFGVNYDENKVKDASYYASLTLNDNIDINFTIQGVSSGFDKSKLSITVDDVLIDSNKIKSTSTGIECVIASVPAHKIGTAITVKVYYDSVEPVKIIENYSIMKYCNAVITAYSSYAQYAKLCNLCKAVLNYGAFTENNKNKNNNSTTNQGVAYTDIDAVLNTYGGVPTIPETGFVPNDVFTEAKASLILDSQITLKFTITTSEDSLSAEDFLIVNNNKENVNRNNIVVEKTGTGYIVLVKNIGASKLSRYYTLTIKDIEEEQFKITFGVYSYCTKVIGHVTDANITEQLKTLCKSIIIYSETAKAYTAK